MSASKRKGTAAESAVVTVLREEGWAGAERRALAGSADLGDVTGIPGVCIEVKNRSVIDLAGAVDEAEAERTNARAEVGFAVIKRRGRGNPRDWYVALPLGRMLALLKEAGY